MGPEFGQDEGKTCISVCVFYGLNHGRTALFKHLGDYMSSLDYKTFPADPDLDLSLVSEGILSQSFNYYSKRAGGSPWLFFIRSYIRYNV